MDLFYVFAVFVMFNEYNICFVILQCLNIDEQQHKTNVAGNPSGTATQITQLFCYTPLSSLSSFYWR